jgi:hypothetical protein
LTDEPSVHLSSLENVFEPQAQRAAELIPQLLAKLGSRLSARPVLALSAPRPYARVAIFSVQTFGRRTGLSFRAVQPAMQPAVQSAMQKSLQPRVQPAWQTSVQPLLTAAVQGAPQPAEKNQFCRQGSGNRARESHERNNCARLLFVRVVASRRSVRGLSGWDPPKCRAPAGRYFCLSHFSGFCFSDCTLGESLTCPPSPFCSAFQIDARELHTHTPHHASRSRDKTRGETNRARERMREFERVRAI